MFDVSFIKNNYWLENSVKPVVDLPLNRFSYFCQGVIIVYQQNCVKRLYSEFFWSAFSRIRAE